LEKDRGESVGKRSGSALDLLGKTGYNRGKLDFQFSCAVGKKGQESVQDIHIRETEYSRRRAGDPAPVVFLSLDSNLN
jgi:hypothetical protein